MQKPKITFANWTLCLVQNPPVSLCIFFSFSLSFGFDFDWIKFKMLDLSIFCVCTICLLWNQQVHNQKNFIEIVVTTQTTVAVMHYAM